MAAWTPCPFASDSQLDVQTVVQAWQRLHAGDAEPMPEHDELLHGWVLFHRGEYQQAAELGLALGDIGASLANKSTAIYANYIEPIESVRLELLLEVARRAELHTQLQPQCPNAHYWQAYALGRYSQGISVAKALAQGLGARIRHALQRAVELQPQHADAHAALGTFHAELIDKVGPLIAGMTYGAKKELSLAAFERALQLHPQSITGLIEYARALVMLLGDSAVDESTRLYQRAVATEALDARERMDQERARQELELE